MLPHKLPHQTDYRSLNNNCILIRIAGRMRSFHFGSAQQRLLHRAVTSCAPIVHSGMLNTLSLLKPVGPVPVQFDRERVKWLAQDDNGEGSARWQPFKDPQCHNYKTGWCDRPSRCWHACGTHVLKAHAMQHMHEQEAHGVDTGGYGKELAKTVGELLEEVSDGPFVLPVCAIR